MKDIKKLWTDVQLLLDSEFFHQYSNEFDRRPMIKLANDLGGAPMKLVHWKKIEELKRIPKHDEIHVVDALRGINNYLIDEVEIFMISHRWLRPSLTVSAHPDDINNRKATAITEFSMWRRQWVLSKHGFLPEIFYWIDFWLFGNSRGSHQM